MQDLQEIFVRIEENKKKLREINKAYREALSSVSEYTDVSDELKTFRERKKQIENTVKEQFSKEFIQMDDIKIDIESDQEMLTDITLNQYVKGQSVSVNDQYENEYEPVFTVKFKKVK
ncbi:MAG: hypothetical protein COV59_03180 [Candidatus Magasanikbacteria bacterium CG11_big_fil_rev_8_21_14_0_20_39_34]|uniref:Uncharacterized protein n=1 Tax=Candidatus Magasanikbacteria bacterium CG11_big_fil_rev_8_21_14_0_20_39_34 TaxID=1974653 RepID=A0A2H0N5J6_9BACT|nr:MAG: hypothetical protein COV59_03180 [Candidatus Magasanikbacteria bacterium CG11_big_fil_rev_8_21_14_0_20_39_34]